VPDSHDSGRPPGRRRAERPTGQTRKRPGSVTRSGTRTRRQSRSSRWLRSPVVAGATALAIAGVGAVLVSSGAAGTSSVNASGGGNLQRLSVHLPSGGTAGQPEAGDVGVLGDRSAPVVDVSRGLDRETVEQQIEIQAAQRNEALADLADAAEQRANELRQEAQQEARERRAAQWVLPLTGYQITATFGESSYLWSTVHTGLDFAAAEGTPLVAVAQGTITETAYDGAYGNKTVLTLEDGTEIWYCHQSSQAVSVGDVVAPGETIGAVGSTGNTTGPHLHLEVHPDAGDAVDPSSVLAEHGVSP